MATNCDKITKAEHQIQVAEALADDIKIFNLIDSSKAELLSSNPEDKEYKYRYKISVDSPSLLYICTKRAYHVSVNEQKAFFPFFDDLINTQFKKNTCNNLRLITEFDKNEVANIDITLSSKSGNKCFKTFISFLPFFVLAVFLTSFLVNIPGTK